MIVHPDGPHEVRVAVLTACSSRSGGGVFAAVNNFARQLAAEPGLSIRTFGLADRFTKADLSTWAGAAISAYSQLGPRAYGYAPRYVSDVLAFAPHIVHLHGLWMSPSRAARIVTRRTSARLIVSPHGSLTQHALTQSRYRKKLMWLLQERHLLRHVAAFHVTEKTEKDQLAGLGFGRPIVQVPLGMDCPPNIPQDQSRATRRILYLGRLHKGKGLDVLLESWSRVAAQFPDWEVALVGPDENRYKRYLDALIRTRCIPRVSICDPVYNKEKELEYRRSDIFVLPSRSENFGLTVAEALSYGIPTVCTTNTPWQGIVERRCGWWVEGTVSELAKALAAGMALTDAERRSMGLRGSAWIRADFSWSRAAQKLKSLYLHIATGDRVTATMTDDQNAD